jgi:hypothetical protein
MLREEMSETHRPNLRVLCHWGKDLEDFTLELCDPLLVGYLDPESRHIHLSLDDRRGNERMSEVEKGQTVPDLRERGRLRKHSDRDRSVRFFFYSAQPAQPLRAKMAQVGVYDFSSRRLDLRRFRKNARGIEVLAKHYGAKLVLAFCRRVNVWSPVAHPADRTGDAFSKLRIASPFPT